MLPAGTSDSKTRSRLPKASAGIYRWLVEHDRLPNSDEDPYDDRIIAAWRTAGDAMAAELGNLDTEARG